MSKKVIIIGAGIAGLSAGVYAVQSGFDVTILEQHSIPGGFCTSWRRGGYLFEGGLHWLAGSSENQPMHKVWRNLGAIDDNTKVFTGDPPMVYDRQGRQIRFYRDVEKLREHLIGFAPEDKKEINNFCNTVKSFSKLAMPLNDIKGVKVKEKSGMKLSALLSMLPALMKMMKYNKISMPEYAKRFKNPIIRSFFADQVGEDYPTSMIFFPLGFYASGDAGYLEGGSLKMAQNIANRFTSLGGRIQYKTKVEQVLVENGKAVGVLANGEEIIADSVVVTVDTLAAIDKLFTKPLSESWTDKVRSLKDKLTINTFISFGVEEDLSDLPASVTFSLEKPFEYAGTEHKVISVNNYAAYKDYAPEGYTAMTVILNGDTYDFWKKHKENGTYEDEKKKIAETVINILSEKIPQIKNKVSVVDVATPLTYERYCGSFHGSWMTNMDKGDKPTEYPLKSESVQNLYFAGQRMQPPGGMPPAADTGRKAVQYLCRDTGTVFQGKAKPLNQ